MKITIIGSSQYKQRFLDHKKELECQGHEVRIPAFDDHPEFDELDVCNYNKEAIKWASRIDIIWDQRSIGTIFDFGMAFALDKIIKIIYIEPKTICGVMEKYEKLFLFRREEVACG
jgi:hypothetical protein